MNVLLTGASSGFGKLATLSLLSHGHTVVASMRNAGSRNKASADELTAAGAHIVEIDVTDQTGVDAGIARAIEWAGGLDAVVNNAGLGVLGVQECFTADDWQRLFDINVFGIQRVNRAVIPHMREQHSGLLISVSSLLGRFVLPFFGPYNASKFAVEAMADNYRVELSGFGIESCLIEPGGYPTDFMEKLIKPSDTERVTALGDFAKGGEEMMVNFEAAMAANPAQNPQDVADAIVHLIETPAGQRPFRTTVDKMGMGDHIAAANEQYEQIIAGIYRAFGMEGMLSVKTDF